MEKFKDLIEAAAKMTDMQKELAKQLKKNIKKYDVKIKKRTKGDIKDSEYSYGDYMAVIKVIRKDCDEWGEGMRNSGGDCTLELDVEIHKITDIMQDLGISYVGIDSTKEQSGYRTEKTSIARMTRNVYENVDSIIVFDYPADPLPDFSI